MANRCQLCPGSPKVDAADWRSVWVGNFYLEWGRECNEKDLKELMGEYPTFTNGKGEVFHPHTPQEMWVLFLPNHADVWGEMFWPGQ